MRFRGSASGEPPAKVAGNSNDERGLKIRLNFSGGLPIIMESAGVVCATFAVSLI
jgi:hypothetical protein